MKLVGGAFLYDISKRKLDYIDKDKCINILAKKYNLNKNQKEILKSKNYEDIVMGKTFKKVGQGIFETPIKAGEFLFIGIGQGKEQIVQFIRKVLPV